MYASDHESETIPVLLGSEATLRITEESELG